MQISKALRILGIFSAVLLLPCGKAYCQKTIMPAPSPPSPSELFEVSLGFDYLHVPDAFAENMYGLDASVFVNANSWLALGGQLIADVGHDTHKVFFRNVDFDESRVAYLFGPRVTVWRRHNWKLFLEALGGGAHGHVEATVFNFHQTASADGFAAALGAGANWQFAQHWSWRVLEADYQPVHFNGNWEDEWRLSSGIAYSFGRGW